MLRKPAIGVACASLALAGCCTSYPWQPEISPDRIVFYVGPPPHNYFKVGTVSSPGAPNTVAAWKRDTVAAQHYHKLQLEAACLGATGVILTDQVPPDDPDYWLYPHTGVAIRDATSSL